MQPVLKRGSIDNPLTFDAGLIQLFSYQCVHLIHATYFSQIAHFSAFHLCGNIIYANYARVVVRVHK